MQNDNLARVDDFFSGLENFKRQLDEIKPTIGRGDFYDVMRDFRYYLMEHDTDEFAEMIRHSKYYDEFCTYFREKNYFYMRSVESLETLHILSKGIQPQQGIDGLIDIDYILERYKRKKHELSLMDFSNAKKAIIVGSGPFPDTMLYLSENTDLEHIVGLDNNYEAVIYSNLLIESLGNKRMHCEHIDGREYDYSDADIVFIPGFANPKDGILEQIAKSAPDHVQIIIDNVTGILHLLFDVVTDAKHMRIEHKDDVSSTSPYYRTVFSKYGLYNY